MQGQLPIGSESETDLTILDLTTVFLGASLRARFIKLGKLAWECNSITDDAQIKDHRYSRMISTIYQQQRKLT